MADMFEYLRWRGDLRFSQVPLNHVDALILSTLAYVHYDGVVREDPLYVAPLKDVAREVLALPEPENRCRVLNDLELLRAASQTERFGAIGMTCYRNVFIPEEDTQFAAVTFLLEDGTAFLAFRGTDNSLVGWKEDFNMTFQESIPAQRLADEYTQTFAYLKSLPLYLGGHSKGGNLAVYAGAKCGTEIQDRILRVYNHDGPGFTEAMMTDPGYMRIVPKIKTLVPQSSVFGMLLEHEEPYIVIRSREIGLMQHDPYSWEIMGGDFIPMEELTADSRFLDRTFRTWLAGMDPAERNEFFDTVFDLLMMENASRPSDIIRPQNIRAFFTTLQTDPERRKIIASVLLELVDAARQAQLPQAQKEE
ncbi:MAG: DUF2974 domain-containing protein [Oscillospiraceae bacterium]|nr:DUF2974 domain-containing protein [Oscillospiraceae bacterium]